ncbi:MAG: hypothetical protein MHPSP_000440 [Paramarteilia canceri]
MDETVAEKEILVEIKKMATSIINRLQHLQHNDLNPEIVSEYIYDILRLFLKKKIHIRKENIKYIKSELLKEKLRSFMKRLLINCKVKSEDFFNSLMQILKIIICDKNSSKVNFCLNPELFGEKKSDDIIDYYNNMESQNSDFIDSEEVNTNLKVEETAPFDKNIILKANSQTNIQDRNISHCINDNKEKLPSLIMIKKLNKKEVNLSDYGLKKLKIWNLIDEMSYEIPFKNEIDVFLIRKLTIV